MYYINRGEVVEVARMSRSTAVKQARAGKDMGKKGKMFKKIEAKATKQYGSKARGKKVAGAVFWKKQKKGQL